jgi:hypothetical protein
MQISSVRKKQIYISVAALVVIIIVYIIYPAVNEYRLKKLSRNITPSEIIASNTVENISYTGTDLSGKQYNVRARLAGIQSDNQDIINLIDVDSDFLLKDGTVIKASSEKGIFNKNTNDVLFEIKVKITYLSDTITCNKAEFLGKSNFITMSGNIIANLVDKNEKKKSSKLMADSLVYDTLKKSAIMETVDKTKQVTAILSNEK